MKTVEISTHINQFGLWQCRATFPTLGNVVIGSGRDEYKAQYQAAQFMDTNYPDFAVHWIGGYHGGDTSRESVVVPSEYWGER